MIRRIKELLRGKVCKWLGIEDVKNLSPIDIAERFREPVLESLTSEELTELFTDDLLDAAELYQSKLPCDPTSYLMSDLYEGKNKMEFYPFLVRIAAIVSQLSHEEDPEKLSSSMAVGVRLLVEYMLSINPNLFQSDPLVDALHQNGGEVDLDQMWKLVDLLPPAPRVWFSFHWKGERQLFLDLRVKDVLYHTYRPGRKRIEIGVVMNNGDLVKLIHEGKMTSPLFLIQKNPEIHASTRIFFEQAVTHLPTNYEKYEGFSAFTLSPPSFDPEHMADLYDILVLGCVHHSVFEKMKEKIRLQINSNKTSLSATVGDLRTEEEREEPSYEEWQVQKGEWKC